MAELEGKRALVTGGTGGIGAAVAHSLVRAGAYVIVSDLNEAACKKVADDLRSDGFNAGFRAMDVTSPEDVEAAFGEFDEHGGVDILITSAAIAKASPILDVKLEDWHRIETGNLSGVKRLEGAAVLA